MLKFLHTPEKGIAAHLKGARDDMIFRWEIAVSRNMIRTFSNSTPMAKYTADPITGN